MKNSNENNEVEVLVDNIQNNSLAEQDKINIKSIRSLNLISFIDSQIQKASAENKLKQLVSTKIKKILESDEDVDITKLTYLLSALNKSDNDFTLGMVTAIKDFYQIEKESERNPPEDDNESIEGNTTAKDIRNIKNFLKVFGEFSKSEFPEAGE
jgi:hypothetical protein